jgi:3-carboxy-cis,cis-muconate cycloisomerase
VPTTLDCEVLCDLYGSAGLRRVFDSRALIQGWLDAERALAEAEAEVGLIPIAAAKRIGREADASLYDLAELRSGIAESQHPLVPLIRALASRCGEHGYFVHWGATTQDIIDTGLVLQVRAALALIRADLERSVAAAARLARRYADTPMPGRTHGQHAVPITFGFKAAIWTEQLRSSAVRLRGTEQAALATQLGGAAGTLAALGPHAAAVRAAFAKRLELADPEIPWHTDRGRVRDLGHALGEIATAGEQIAAEIILLQSTEIAELAEPSTDHHVGSSTMPQKQNPMTCEYLVASARLARGAVGVLFSSGVHAHERDMAAWATEWLALPQALILTGGVLEKLDRILEELVVETGKMTQNLDLTRGQIMAEAAMMELASSIGHEQAHQLVGEAARRASRERRDFAAVLAERLNDTVSPSSNQLERILDPAGYLGLASNVAEAASARAEQSLAPAPPTDRRRSS